MSPIRIAGRPSPLRRAGGRLGLAAIFSALLAHARLAAGEGPVGEAIYERCLACHAVERNRTGPRHCGLAGRRAGSVPGFVYSEAMKRADIVWTTETLDGFLADPFAYLPGTSMGYDGVKDDRERAALIPWLLALEECP